jgi:hypothetical protein
MLVLISMSGGEQSADEQAAAPTPIATPAVPDIKKQPTPAVRVVKVPANKPRSTDAKGLVPAPAEKSADTLRAEAEAAKKAAAIKAEKLLKKNLKRARKAFASGRLKRAERLVKAVLSGDPANSDGKKLAKRITRLNKAVSAGRTAIKRHDCVRALKVLEPVMKDAPESLGLLKMVEDCRQALPPRQL